MAGFPAPQTPRGFGSGKTGMRTRTTRFGRTVVALMLREMASRYGRSPGGYVWAVMEPLGMILLLSIGFSLVMRSPALGNSFLLFYATGFLPFNLYQRLANTVGTSLPFSRNLLTYPAVSWFDAISARFVLNTMTQLLVSYVLMVGILVVIDSPVVLSFGPILFAFACAALLGLGVGLVNAVLFGLVPVWQPIYRILNRPLFLASGIILIYESMPPLAQDILWWNPLLHITGRAHEGFFAMYTPQYVVNAYPIGWGLVLTALGLLLLRRHHARILQNS
ncbi:MAG: capsular polysaccharide transport system permease protein [Rhodobacteraceae bacterium HLUCCA08]|nr:MAG: capsular polysaccharide transport system permease protein [Rhodobacteraceae bacterium HLUCCA08]